MNIMSFIMFVIHTTASNVVVVVAGFGLNFGLGLFSRRWSWLRLVVILLSVYSCYRYFD